MVDLAMVAWAPDEEERDWSVAAGLAAAWVDQRCAAEGAAGVLVTNSLDHLGVPELDAFERRHTRTSRRASRDRVGRGAGPVLSYVPGIDELAFAMRLARGSSLAVVETPSFPLGGWAAQLGALDLVTGEKTPSLPDAINDAVEKLKFVGNNGFGDQYGKRRATALVADLAGRGLLDGDLLVGAVLAAGVSENGAKNLAKLIEKAR